MLLGWIFNLQLLGKLLFAHQPAKELSGFPTCIQDLSTLHFEQGSIHLSGTSLRSMVFKGINRNPKLSSTHLV